MDCEVRMYVRVTTIKLSPEDIDGTIRHFEEVILPEARTLPGFKGLTALVDREKGTIQVLADWNSRETLDASAETARRLREKLVDAAKNAEIVSVDTFELAVQEART